MGEYIRWIPTGQRLPTKEDRYLITIDKGETRSVEFSNFETGGNSGRWSYKGPGTVMAWADEPAPCMRNLKDTRPRPTGPRKIQYRPDEKVLLDRIEHALGEVLTENQKKLITGKIMEMPPGRQTGRTVAYLIRLAISEGRPLHLYVGGEDFVMVPDHDPIEGMTYNSIKRRIGILKGLYGKLSAEPGIALRKIYFSKEEAEEDGAAQE